MPDPPAKSAPAASPVASPAAKTATAAAATTAVKAATTAAASKLPDDISKHMHGLYGDDEMFGFNHTDLPSSKFDSSKYKYNADDYKWDSKYDYLGQMDWKHRWMDRAYHALTIICILIIASWVLQFIMYRKHDVLEWIKRRRMAAKVPARAHVTCGLRRLPPIPVTDRVRSCPVLPQYKRVKKHEGLAPADEAGPDTMSGGESGGEEEIGLLEIVTSSFTSDASVPCVVDLGDGKATRTCEAYVGTLEKVSELPFMLTEACRASGDPELGALSLVDLYLKDRIKLEYTSGSGNGDVKKVGKYGETTPDMLLKAKGFRVTVLAQTTR